MADLRAPWTKDFVCSVHGRPGNHPQEAFCAAHLFKPAGEEGTSGTSSAYAPGATEPGPWAPKEAAPAHKYRKRPEPPEVTASAMGGLMMISTGTGPEFPMPRDQFFALYELVEPEELPETAGALADAPALAHDVAKTALLEPGQQGNAAAAPYKAPSGDDTDDEETIESSEEKTPQPPKKGRHR